MSVKKTQIEVFQIDEDLIIKALRAMPEMKMTLSIEDVNILLKLLEKQQKENLNVKIELYIIRKDYVEAFECLIRAKNPDRLFNWI